MRPRSNSPSVKSRPRGRLHQFEGNVPGQAGEDVRAGEVAAEGLADFVADDGVAAADVQKFRSARDVGADGADENFAAELGVNSMINQQIQCSAL